jgi:hypothetical protein
MTQAVPLESTRVSSHTSAQRGRDSRRAHRWCSLLRRDAVATSSLQRRRRARPYRAGPPPPPPPHPLSPPSPHPLPTPIFLLGFVRQRLQRWKRLLLQLRPRFGSSRCTYPPLSSFSFSFCTVKHMLMSMSYPIDPPGALLGSICLIFPLI